MENPFKFGTIVEEEYFTDRVDEVEYICQFAMPQGQESDITMADV